MLSRYITIEMILQKILGRFTTKSILSRLLILQLILQKIWGRFPREKYAVKISQPRDDFVENLGQVSHE